MTRKAVMIRLPSPAPLRALVLALTVLALPAGAETPEEFAKRIEKGKSVHPVVNRRDDGSFGSVSIGVHPEVVADRGKLDPLLGQVAKFAAASRLKADVLTPQAADAEHMAQKLRADGVAGVGTKVMAPTVSIKTTRIFLTPQGRPEPPRPPAAAPGK